MRADASRNVLRRFRIEKLLFFFFRVLFEFFRVVIQIAEIEFVFMRGRGVGRTVGISEFARLFIVDRRVHIIADMIVNFAATLIGFGAFRRELDAFRERVDAFFPHSLILARDALEEPRFGVLSVNFKDRVGVVGRLLEVFVRFCGFRASFVDLLIRRGGLRETIMFSSARERRGGASVVGVDIVRIRGDRRRKRVVRARPIAFVERGLPRRFSRSVGV